MVLDRHASGFAWLDEAGKMVSQEGKPVFLNQVQEGAEALAQEHAGDAHFVCYGVIGADGQLPAIPRLTKGVLPLLVEMGLVGSTSDVVGVAVALDYDLPEHTRWTTSTLTQAVDLFRELAAKNPLFANPSLFYTTSGGCRFVWLLDQPIPVEGRGGLEDLLSGTVAAAHFAGLAADPACRDWTRLFRFPRVRRLDKAPAEARTQDQSYFRMSWGRVDLQAREVEPPARVITHSPAAFARLSDLTPQHFEVNQSAKALGQRWSHLIGRDPGSSTQRQANIRLGDTPDDVDVQRLVAFDGKNPAPEIKRIDAEIQALASPRGRDTKPLPSAIEALRVLHGGTSLFLDETKQEGLHEGILRFCRNLCFCMRDKLGEQTGDVTPTALFALVIQHARVANALRAPEAQRPDAVLKTEVWRALGHVYRQFRAVALDREQQRNEEQAAVAVQAETNRLFSDALERQITGQIKQWVMGSVPGEQRRREAAAALSSGTEDHTQVTMLERWVDTNWRKLLMLEVPKVGRSVLALTPQGGITYSIAAKSDGAAYAAIRDSGHALISDERPAPKPGDEPVLRPMVAIMREFGTQVEARLSRLRSSRIEAFVTDQKEVIPRLVLHAPGIRSDIEPCFDPLVDKWLRLLGGQWHEKVLDWLACFPYLDRKVCGLYIEGPPNIGKGMLSEGLRRLTESGEAAPFGQVMDQFQDSMMKTPFVWADEESEGLGGRSKKSVMNVYKKLVTGEYRNLNGKGKDSVDVEGYWRVLLTANSNKLLTWDEDVNESDLGALVQRTLHVHADKAADEFLREIGGAAGTAGWPEANIPQHIMWLAKNRAVVPGQRLYVEGFRSDFHESLMVNTGGTDSVTRALGTLLADVDRYQSVLKLDRETGEILVNASALRKIMVQIQSDDRSSKVPSIRHVGQALKHLSGNSKNLLRNFGQGMMRVWRLDVPTLLRTLDRLGESFDLRKAFGPTMWDRLAPAALKDLLVQADAEAKGRPVPSAAWLGQRSNVGGPGANGHTNGHANGHANDHANGHTNGQAPPAPPPGPPVRHAFSPTKPAIGSTA